MKIYCVFSLESPHQDDYNEYSQYTIYNVNKKNTLNYPRSAAKGLKNEFVTALAKEQTLFEPLKFYCIVL